MYDFLADKLVGASDLGRARVASSKRLTLIDELGSRSAVDCSVNATSTEKGVVGGVYDSIDC